jgi:hypothetical protein
MMVALERVRIEKVEKSCPYYDGRRVPPGSCIQDTSILVPLHILQKTPLYKSELEDALRTTASYNVPTIKVVRFPAEGQKTFIKTINFLGGTPLPSLDAAGSEDIDILKSLLTVYNVCLELQTEELAHAVLAHIESYQYSKLQTFIDFAREVYGDTGSEKHAVDSIIGKAFKPKLTELFPHLLQGGDVQRINAMGGVLNIELFDIATKHLAVIPNMKAEKKTE